jgi:Tfp pilus assembly protein PilN
MPNINLIATRREEQMRLVRLTRNLFLSLAASIAGFIALALFLAAQNLTMTGDLRDTEARMSKLQPVLEQIDRIKADTDLLGPKVDTLKAAKAGITKWRAVLQVVSDAVPDNTYLSSLNATGSVDDTTISLGGISESQSVVGEMMTRLGNHPLFDRVDLHYTQAAVQAATPGATADPSQQGVQFEIAAHLRGTPTPPPPPAPDKTDGAK